MLKSVHALLLKGAALLVFRNSQVIRTINPGSRRIINSRTNYISIRIGAISRINSDSRTNYISRSINHISGRRNDGGDDRDSRAVGRCVLFS